jgi:pimeloyl-ACP methyl ester carboxylesterase
VSRYLLVHGAWHTGNALGEVAAVIRAAGHEVLTPTLTGNRPGDSKSTGLAEAIGSMVEYVAENDLAEIILVGHSYGGMIITGVADVAPQRLRRLVYWNAFVPNHNESVSDMLPSQYIELFERSAAERGDGSVVLPFQIWREAFMNDVDLGAAERAYRTLNPHPLKTLTDKISLETNPAGMGVAKSYVNCMDDTSLPHHYPWHPRLSQKLGLFRLIQLPGGHELCFSDPERLARRSLQPGGTERQPVGQRLHDGDGL